MKTDFKDILEAESVGFLHTLDVENNRKIQDQRFILVDLPSG